MKGSFQSHNNSNDQIQNIRNAIHEDQEMRNKQKIYGSRMKLMHGDFGGKSYLKIKKAVYILISIS